MLANAGARACGPCGEFREATKAHVPPRAAGNTTSVERAADLIDANRVRRPGTVGTPRVAVAVRFAPARARHRDARPDSGDRGRTAGR